VPKLNLATTEADLLHCRPWVGPCTAPTASGPTKTSAKDHDSLIVRTVADVVVSSEALLHDG
jgi:hypothetical protein